jgi:plastocyanin
MDVIMLSLFILTAALTATPSHAATEPHNIEMKSLSFAPKTLTIKVGESVRWTNVAYMEHSATSDDKKTFDTGLIKKGKQSKTVVFATAGVFKYHCAIHQTAMTGVIEVKP